MWIWQQPAWPRFEWDEKRVTPLLLQARRAQGELIGRMALLRDDDRLRAELELCLSEGLQTAAIEGENLNPEAVRSSLLRRLGLEGSLTPVPREVDGLIEVLLDATGRYAQPMTPERLNGWHAALFPTGYSGLKRIAAGHLRTGTEPMQVVSGAIGREKVHFEAPPSNTLPREMTAFLAWLENPDETDGLIRAALTHLWFVTLHPYEDGNGRLARALSDLALARDEKKPVRLYALSAQIMKRRSDYYRILEATQKGGLDVTAWIVWFLEVFLATLDEARAVLEKVLFKTRFWVRHAPTPLNERQRKALNRLLDDGEEFKGGLNNRKYASLTHASRATAFRELADLVAKGCLVATGEGRSVRYEIAPF
ncbi:MAG: Fic family protein [Campylobacterales bacterium]